MKEILKHLAEKISLPEDSYLDQDTEILEIFIEELEENFQELNQLVPQWLTHPDEHKLLVEIRRHFHTLKGSGRMIGAKSSSELAWAVEEILNRIIAQRLRLSSDLQRYVQAVFHVYRFKFYDDFKQRQAHALDIRPLILLGQQLQQQQRIEPALEELLLLAEQLNALSGIMGLEIKEESRDEAENTEAVAIPDNDRLMKETWAIFTEEAEEHLQTIDAFLQQDEPTDQSYNQLIRALHTLRGSSSMADIQQVFDASSKVENLFKLLMQNALRSTSNEIALLTHYAEFVRDYLYTLHQQGSLQQLDHLAQKFNQVWENCGFSNETNADDMQHLQGMVTALLQLNIENLLNTEHEFEKRVKQEFPAYIQQLIHESELLIKHTDNRVAQGVHDYLLQLKPAYEQLLQKPALLHIGFAFDLFAQAHQQVIHLFDQLATGQRVSLVKEQQSVLNDLQDFVQQDVEIFKDVVAEEPIASGEPEIIPIQQTSVVESTNSHFDLSQISSQIQQDQRNIDEQQVHRNFDADLLGIFLEEADELLVGIDTDLNIWSQQQRNTSALNNLMRYLHTLKGGANMVQATHIGLIAHELETIYERLIYGQLRPSANLIQIIRLVQDAIADRIQTLRDQAMDYPATQLLSLLTHIEQVVQSVAQQSRSDVDSSQTQPVEIVLKDDPIAAPSETLANELAVDMEHQSMSELSIPNVLEPTEPDEQLRDLASTVLDHEVQQPPLISTFDAVKEHVFDQNQDIDPDGVRSLAEATFDEEAEELLKTAYQLLNRWFGDRANRSVLLQLQGTMYSLKDGARMLELEPVAVIAQHLENVFERFAAKNFSSNAHDDLLLTALNWLKHAIFECAYHHYESLKHTLEHLEFVNTNAQIPTQLAQTGIFLPEQAALVQGDGTEPPSMLGEWSDTAQVDNSNEMIRISSDLIEKVINLSGENAINRSRVEMDLGQLGNTLVEMQLAIQRLADQLRRLEGELESQIIAKHGAENLGYVDFDPLEMDQYSSLNQLSKSLAESASDLLDFKTTLADKIRETESLLLQQSRIQTEIQENLLRTRLIPFSRLLPRLQRIVRQTATSLNRSAELIVHNTEGELDRTLLERLVTPLEHMLRNAVDHGLEDRDERLRLGKPETGCIALNISRQGTDVLVSFSDDGKGIDIEKIKAKALQDGLMTAEQKLDTQEILQYIFHPGFSTAVEVTQISGRGVGLDVVQNEIKALGGHVSVESKRGLGTTFTIRVPTTVAVSDALMVRGGGDQLFAFPLAQIDRIVRIAPSVLEQYFSSQDDYFNIDHLPYRLRYLGELTANQSVPKLSSVAHSLPVLLIKAAHGQTIALLVDQLIGSRVKIVVKPIGQQFASIGMIAGATILGDGQVCLILDGQNIARQIQATHRKKQHAQGIETTRHTNERRLVMIVDDSVTVRKVTSRLLMRQGFDVLTAKDGLDAMEQLENVKPDLMLLDIEMPRMDGFEVTNLVRHHELHQNMPIIMITSRVGEKHRERALSLGVSHYMGKPYQEAELLAKIEDLLETHSGSY